MIEVKFVESSGVFKIDENSPSMMSVPFLPIPEDIMKDGREYEAKLKEKTKGLTCIHLDHPNSIFEIVVSSKGCEINRGFCCQDFMDSVKKAIGDFPLKS